MELIQQRTSPAIATKSVTPRLLAFYLPQFYPTSYNSEWWGPGFTEWTNVAQARPRFHGHYQPHIPADLGFYDLRLPETRQAQAEMAMEYGIYGFCYYHYWFSGRRVLEVPLNEVLRLKSPDFPFCICWANENWTRVWDGKSKEVLLNKYYSEEDDLRHIRSLFSTLDDSRYIRIEGKPLVLIYRPEALHDSAKTLDTWQSETIKAGIGPLFMVNVESNFISIPQMVARAGFDAAVSFEPNSNHLRYSTLDKLLTRLNFLSYRPGVYSYDDFHHFWQSSAVPDYRRFDCVFPSWDNSARRINGATVITGATPEKYGAWLGDALDRAKVDSEGHKWVFVNAWNEWAEGCHLEPCHKWGRGYLEMTKQTVLREIEKRCK